MKTYVKHNNTKEIEFTKEQMDYIEECIRISEEQIKNGQYFTIDGAREYVMKYTRKLDG